LFTSILGTRNVDAGRYGSNGSRSRRAARQAERAAADSSKSNGAIAANGAGHDLDGFNGLVSETASSAAEASLAEREPEVMPTRAEGKGD
jgi:hypothetical protein